ncbi:MAG TPA: 2-dehydro-3-deoxy-6-phosphogalactonate aldolase [Beijerinckiaceae bacterium]|jgi:2-dehydro-3-deoxyphosphogalactonate aldolase|nr:2-dehydro-3-deoxy-6-phosphogalactonate aldolase [Beijerinckiaceae bacterium]
MPPTSMARPAQADLRNRLRDLPLIAILRGLQPDAAAEVGEVLVEAGFRIIEVPLNSPQPLSSIERLARALPASVLVGAGTVLDLGDVDRVRDAGGRLIVMPHSDPDVIGRARDRGLVCTPGVATPTEGFAALKAGADALKLFPAEALPPPILKAWRAVFPPDTLMLPVGGIRPDTMKPFVDAGANGFGLGSALFTPKLTAAEVARNARDFATAWRALGAGNSAAGDRC